MRHDRLVHRLGHKKTLSSFSRFGVAQDYISPITKSTSYANVQSKLIRSRHVFVGRAEASIRQRMIEALEEHSESPAPAQSHIRRSSTFVSTSRQYHDNLVRSQAPPLGSYNPKYSVLQRASPSPSFSRASERWPVHVSSSPESTQRCSRVRNPGRKRIRLPGLSFAKQMRRADFVDPKKGPHERRFMMVANSSFDSAQVHSFDSYASRTDLFPLPPHQPDYDPKYDFVRPK